MIAAAPPRVDRARVAPVLVAGIAALAWLISDPPSVDLAAHAYRAKAPFSLWDGGWYGGHHTPGYSVLFPPLGWLVGVRLAGALAAVAATALFESLVRPRYPRRALAGATWFAVATTMTLFDGRLTYMLGVAVGLAAFVAFDRGRLVVAALLAVATALASPVAALFLALAAVALAAVGHRRALVLAVAALAPVGLLALAFPEGGWEPFAASAFIPLPVLSVAAVVLLPARERALRAGFVLYALAGTAAFALHTPVGGNVVRLGAMVGGPLLVCALPLRRLVLCAAFAWWLVSPAVTDVAKVDGDPAARAAYYRPLTGFLERQRGAPARVEIPFTRAHWEAAYVAPRFPLARGWERQLDVGRNPLFYGAAPLTPATYAAWLSAHAVRWVALPDATLDYAATREAALIRRGLPYLVPRWSGAHWRVYEFVGPRALVAAYPPARMRAVSFDRIAVTRPGTALVRVEWSPYWRLDGGCAERAGEWTRIETRRTGTLRLHIAFALDRVFDRGRRCG